MTRVFVSSVSEGLEETRRQIIFDLRTAGYHVDAMEQFGAQVERSIEVCLRELRKAGVVVLIVGPRYGSILPEGISFTQKEFREAREKGIPILAFRVAHRADLLDDERDRIATFLSEVSSTSVYDRIEPGESLDRLSPKVLAALSNAARLGDIRNRYSLFQPYERFFAAQLGTMIFNHQGPFVGREAQHSQLMAFISGRDPLLLLKAPGGYGKSRLLLEAAKSAVDTVPPVSKVLFVDPGAQWSADDIGQLPATPTVLIFDDAHRRPDLDRLMAACVQHNDQIRFVVSCRPSAVNIVKPLVAQMMVGHATPDIDLPALKKEDAETLAQRCLGADFAGHASRLVKLADGNSLVICVGARCIADRSVPPDILERTAEEFRVLVLDRLMADPGLEQSDSAIRKKILEVIASIGPVATEGAEFVDKLGAVVEVPAHEIRRLLATLERTGFLMRRGRFVRVSPDVLSDHLLYGAAVDENGRPTGFVDAMIKRFAPSLLDNILGNAAELDWRAAATSRHGLVLETAWREMMESLPQATNVQRADLVGRLERAARYAPAEVLRIAEWLAGHPDAPVDAQLVEWGLEDRPQRVVDALTDIFGFIAGHREFTKRCVERLWEFALVDTRPTNPYAGHPRRKLEELVKYQWRSDWRSTGGVHARAVEALIDRLRDPDHPDATWAVRVLGSALDRWGEDIESNRRQITIGSFSLASSLSQISERRESVVSCLRDIALGPRPSEAAEALRELAKLLGVPMGPMGQGIDPAEVTAWEPEAKTAIGLLLEVGKAASSEVVRFIARRELYDGSRRQWPQITSTLDEAVQICPPVARQQLFDLLAGTPWEEGLADWRVREARIVEQSDTVARSLWNEHKTPDRVVDAVLEGVAALRSVGRYFDTGQLIRSIVAAKPEHAEAVVRELEASAENGWPLIKPALLSIHRVQPALAEVLVSKLGAAEEPALRVVALEAMEWMVDRAVDAQGIVAIARSLSRDRSPEVRRAVPQVLGRLRTKAPSAALEILTSVEWGDDPTISHAVFEVLDPKYGLDPNELSDDEIDRLLARIEGLKTLESAANEVLTFIAFASTRRPRQTVEMILTRIRTRDRHSGIGPGDRWTPIPYNGHGLSLPGLKGAQRDLDLSRLIRDAILGASGAVRFWLPELFALAVPDLQGGLFVLREWVSSGNPEKIVGAAHLVRGFGHSIVFSAHEFVADLLDAAERGGGECLRDARSEMHSIAASGTFSGTPGQPMPRHVSNRDEAQNLVRVYSERESARDFYASLVVDAENSIKRHLLEWDEDGDDE